MLESLQYLRAVASLMVVVFHLGAPLSRLGLTAPWPQSGAAGVDIFFVLSGFLMLVTTRGRDSYTLSFYVKRIIRIVPLYWIVTTASLALLLVAPQLVKSGKADAWHILASYLFLPARHPVLGTLEPLVVPGWTLNYEMFFYLLWGVALLLPGRARLPAIALFLSGLAVLGRAVPSENAFLAFYTAPIMLEFVFGLALGLWYLEGPALARGWGFVFIAAGFVSLLAQGDVALETRVIQWGIPAAMVVAGALVLERARPVKRIGAFVLLGDASYALYLVHGMVLSAVGQVFVHLPQPSPLAFVACAIAGVGAAIVVAIAVHLVVEKPLLRLMSARPRASRAAT
ncbi:acyltransferase family protein [Xanthobacter oligotrophicus]|uniref:acyltransferase family protein n=1 Tax=Xanthobacter oligotrophicus TaxID=2607286 RepID=UPI0011F18D0F|nr:acyltransferase [Xanthobacter oligotrophicus]MCG5235024.1 acyltransferase [Xanthobacter oligotrophicus]